MLKHYCKFTEDGISIEHARQLDFHEHGPAVDECVEMEDGALVVHNREYATQVNFCPLCGFAARVKVRSE
jgi:hypothetical protein